jgi:hypothetical protein
MKRYWILAAVAAALWPMLALAQDVGDGTTTPLDSLSDFTMWAVLGGAITSGAAALLNQSHWKSLTKLAVFLVICMVTAGLDAYFKRELDFENWSRALLVVAFSGWGVYLAARPALKQLEAATTVARAV